MNEVRDSKGMLTAVLLLIATATGIAGWLLVKGYPQELMASRASVPIGGRSPSASEGLGGEPGKGSLHEEKARQPATEDSGESVPEAAVAEEYKHDAGCEADRPIPGKLIPAPKLKLVDEYLACPCSNHNPDGLLLDPEDERLLESIISGSNEEIAAFRRSAVSASTDYVRARVELGEYIEPERIKDHPDWGTEGARYTDYIKDGKVSSEIVKPGDDAMVDVAFERTSEAALRGRQAVSSFLASHAH